MANEIFLPNEVLEALWVVISPDDYDHQLEKSEKTDHPDFVYVRKVNNKEQVYKVVEKTLEWVCFKCGSDVLGMPVAHTVRDGLFPCSGGGEVRTETAPYCPKCELQPSPYGSPIMEGKRIYLR